MHGTVDRLQTDLLRLPTMPRANLYFCVLDVSRAKLKPRVECPKCERVPAGLILA